MANMRPLPRHGAHITIEEFKEWVDGEWVIGYDGQGSYATETECEVPGVWFSPSEFKRDYEEKRREFTHLGKS